MSVGLLSSLITEVSIQPHDRHWKRSRAFKFKHIFLKKGKGFLQTLLFVCCCLLLQYVINLPICPSGMINHDVLSLVQYNHVIWAEPVLPLPKTQPDVGDQGSVIDGSVLRHCGFYLYCIFNEKFNRRGRRICMGDPPHPFFTLQSDLCLNFLIPIYVLIYQFM